jgi:hypothetical protein
MSADRISFGRAYISSSQDNFPRKTPSSQDNFPRKNPSSQEKILLPKRNSQDTTRKIYMLIMM